MRLATRIEAALREARQRAAQPSVPRLAGIVVELPPDDEDRFEGLRLCEWSGKLPVWEVEVGS